MSDTSDTDQDAPTPYPVDPNDPNQQPIYRLDNPSQNQDILAENAETPEGFKVQLAPDFGEAGEPIADADALRILTRRLQGSGSMQRTARRMIAAGNGPPAGQSQRLPGQAELARKLLIAMPPAMRTREVLEQGDLRPILQQIAWAPEGESKLGFTYAESWWAGQVILDETDRIRKSAEKAILPTVAPGDELAAVEAGNIIDELVNGYREGKVIKINTQLEQAGEGSIMTDPATGAVRATGGVGEVASDTGFNLDGIEDLEDEEDKVAFLTRDEVEFLAREGLDSGETIGSLLGEDYAKRHGEITGGGTQYEILYDDTTRSETYNVPKSGKQTVTGIPNRMTAREIVDLPKTMNRAQVYRLGKKMKEAGLLPQDMLDPTDWSDPAFKTGWQDLMYKSIERGESMLSILDSQARARREAMEDSFTTSLTDPARVRANADALGANILGRRMTPQEQEQMVTFVHALERRNAKIEAGFDPDKVGTLEELKGEAITADLEARMGEWIKEKNPEEAGGHDVADSYDKLTQLLGGPGQPGIVR